MRKLIVGLFFLLVTKGAIAQTPVPTATPPSSDLVIRVWWSDGLYPLGDDEALSILENQIKEFNTNNPDVDVSLRLKPSEGDGSILNTLIAAQPVAPNAVPDLVLIPVMTCSQGRGQACCVPSIWLPDTLTADLLPNALQLGKIDNVIYGLPYSITLEHLVYQTAVWDADSPITFETLLNAKQRFVFAGVPLPNQEINDVLLAQYLSAGGRLADEAGVPVLDQEPLLDVLMFYSQGVQAGVFTNEIATFSQPYDYWARYTQGEIPLAVTTSSVYLQDQNALQESNFAPLPSAENKGLVIMDGWVWALTTTDPSQQLGALQFIEWIMSAEPQADYTQALGVLPSRRRSIRLWSDSLYMTQLEGWIGGSFILPPEQRNNAAAEQLQAAFVAVLNGTTYEETAKNALAALSLSN